MSEAVILARSVSLFSEQTTGETQAYLRASAEMMRIQYGQIEKLKAERDALRESITAVMEVCTLPAMAQTILHAALDKTKGKP